MPSLASLREHLPRLLGPEVCAALADPEVTEVYSVEGDACLWVATQGEGRRRTGIALAADWAERVLNAVASAKGEALGPGRPILSADLPDRLGRLQGFVSPVTGQCFLVLRKPPGRIPSLLELVAAGFVTEPCAELLRQALVERETILIVGGTGTGKTTFLNVLLAELAALCPQDRIGILEDTPELAPCSPDTFRLRTVEGLDLHRLVKESLRTSPTRLVVGEVRDQAALALLDAWNTGHPGGLATLHANGCHEALVRLSTLIQRAGVPPQPELIVATVSLLVHLVGTSRATRRVAAIARVTGFNPASDRFQVQTLYERNDR